MVLGFRWAYPNGTGNCKLHTNLSKEAHLAALDKGDNVLEVRQQADDTLNTLVTVIRKRFPV